MAETDAPLPRSGRMFRSLPPLAVVLGLAGLIPFAVTALGAISQNYTASLGALVGYGAIILGFLGGVHWGFTIDEPDAPAANTRLGLGVVPALIGWAAVMIGLLGAPRIALATLIGGFIATAVGESRGVRQSLVPSSYMALRWVLTVIVVAILTTVLVLRLLGARLLIL